MRAESGKVERNDYCPCGSGKKYKRCCIGKDFRHSSPMAAAYKNYKGEETRFDPRRADQDVEKLKFLLDLLHSRQQMGIKRALQALQEIYQLFSTLQNHFSAGASCEKGCSYCCHIYITVSRLEAELVRRFVAANFDRAAQDGLLARIRQHQHDYLQQEELELLKDDRESLDNLFEAYLSKQIPCPFLSPAGACRIYPARPFACRSLLVISDPRDCRRHRGVQIRPYNINEYVMASIANLSRKVFGDGSGEKQLPVWFLDGFSPIEEF
ncbi:MAG: SEC-C metal-binding domain-containing protein [Syntrophomonadaceae bacterium]|nr:SEC-C metal-binding domain-containing protein [Syntrophomonadaceae bacterium]